MNLLAASIQSKRDVPAHDGSEAKPCTSDKPRLGAQERKSGWHGGHCSCRRKIAFDPEDKDLGEDNDRAIHTA